MGDDASVNVVRRYFCFSASWISSRFCCCLARSEEAFERFFGVGLQELVLSSLSIRSKLGPNAALLDQVCLVVACFSSSSGIG